MKPISKSLETLKKNNILVETLSAIAQGPTVIYIFEAFGNFTPTFISSNIENQFGYSEDEFLSTPNFWADHIHPVDKERIFSGLESLFDLDHHTHEYRFMHKDGHYIWLHDESKLIRDAEGTPTQIVGHWVNVSESHNLNEELKILTAELNATLESTTDGILVMGNDGAIKRFNQRFIELWNIPENVIAPQNDKQLITYVLNQLSDANSFVDMVEQLYEIPDAESIDYLEFKDGKVFARNSRPLRIKNQKVAGRVWSFRDVTQRQQAEQELIIARDEAKHANDIKSQFLASMSHELRTPLNVIIGFSELMQMKSEIDSTTQHKYISNIITAAHQLLGLINDVLDLSIIEVGKLDINIEPLNIEMITSSCVEQISSVMSSKKNITIENQITDTSLFVYADDLRLRQVLINLLSNAVKYNDDNGQITIRSIVGKENKLRIEIHNTGAGIPKQQIPLLFNLFQRLEQKNSKISGLGIGLYICKQLVEAMHGTIGVESTQGNGSTFWFELSLAEDIDQPAIEPKKIAESNQLSYSKFRVLCIEDNPANRQLVKSVLEKIPGVELTMVETAEEGLVLAENLIPDLILMDLQLPGIDGITATSRLKLHPITKNIPVVALSAYAMKKDIDRALNAGCSLYLTKPIDIKELFKVINEMQMAIKSEKSD